MWPLLSSRSVAAQVSLEVLNISRPCSAQLCLLAPVLWASGQQESAVLGEDSDLYLLPQPGRQLSLLTPKYFAFSLVSGLCILNSLRPHVKSLQGIQRPNFYILWPKKTTLSPAIIMCPMKTLVERKTPNPHLIYTLFLGYNAFLVMNVYRECVITSDILYL